MGETLTAKPVKPRVGRDLLNQATVAYSDLTRQPAKNQTEVVEFALKKVIEQANSQKGESN